MKIIINAIGLSILTWILSNLILLLLPHASRGCAFFVSSVFVFGLYLYIQNEDHWDRR